MTILLTAIALTLTFLMFHTRNMLLGFPSAMFWAILGGNAYTLSVTTWDMYYFLFFASMGMSIFCFYAMYALRMSDLNPPDIDKEKFIDEEKEPEIKSMNEPKFTDESVSPRTQALRDRALKRRGNRIPRKVWRNKD